MKWYYDSTNVMQFCQKEKKKLVVGYKVMRVGSNTFGQTIHTCNKRYYKINHPHHQL
jgi:hypothetical protein